MLEFTLTVANGQTTSPGFDLREVLGTMEQLEDYALCSLFTPATLEATSGQFEFSRDGSSWFPYYDDANAAIDIDLGTTRLIRLRPSDYPVLTPHVRIKLGTAASGASRAFTVGMRKV